jgi:hypothetical protein
VLCYDVEAMITIVGKKGALIRRLAIAAYGNSVVRASPLYDNRWFYRMIEISKSHLARNRKNKLSKDQKDVISNTLEEIEDGEKKLINCVAIVLDYVSNDEEV